jgi:ABC-type bacteriocin/lantibiotic exporter with double-glycine peptidase domain
MTKWLPEGLVVFGSLLGGTSLFIQQWRGAELPVAEQIPGESSAAKDCGAVSLYLICRVSETPSELEQIRKLTKTSVTGTSMFDLKEAAEQLGFRAKGSKCSFESLWDHLSERGHFAILYFTSGHFDPAVQVADGRIKIVDTRRGEIKSCSEDDLTRMGWDGTALLLLK